MITPCGRARLPKAQGRAPGFAPRAALEAKRSSLPVTICPAHPPASTQNAHSCAMQMTKQTIGMPSRTAATRAAMRSWAGQHGPLQAARRGDVHHQEPHRGPLVALGELG